MQGFAEKTLIRWTGSDLGSYEGLYAQHLEPPQTPLQKTTYPKLIIEASEARLEGPDGSEPEINLSPGLSKQARVKNEYSKNTRPELA